MAPFNRKYTTTSINHQLQHFFELSLLDAALLEIIRQLDNGKRGAFASKQYYSERLMVSRKTIHNCINRLIKKNLIYRAGKSIKTRKIVHDVHKVRKYMNLVFKMLNDYVNGVYTYLKDYIQKKTKKAKNNKSKEPEAIPKKELLKKPKEVLEKLLRTFKKQDRHKDYHWRTEALVKIILNGLESRVKKVPI